MNAQVRFLPICRRFHLPRLAPGTDVQVTTPLRTCVPIVSSPEYRQEAILRPDSIVWFERIIIATLLLGIVRGWLDWPQLVSQASPTFVFAVLAIVLIISLGLTLLISRRRSHLAKWISIALFVAGLPTVFSQGFPAGVAGAVSIIQLLAQLLAYSLLFTPAARRWFKRAPAHD